MQFKRGHFHTYRATNKIHLGKYEMDIAENDYFEFDGYSVRYAGVEYGVPQLRPLAGSWFVPAADTTTTYKAQPAGVQVSHATPEARERGDSFTMGEASEEEAVVGTMAEQKAIRTAADNRDTDRLAALRAQRRQRAARIQGQTGGAGEVSVDTNPQAPPPQNAADVDPEVEAALMETAIPQFERAAPVHGAGPAPVVSSTENAAVARANAINQQRIAQMAEHLEQVDPRKSREQMGGTRHDTPDSGVRSVGKGGKYTLIQDDSGGVEVGNYKFSDGASVGSQVIESGEVKRTNVLRTASKQPVQVGRAVAKPAQAKTGAMMMRDAMPAPQAAGARSTTQVTEGRAIDAGAATGDVEVTHSGDDLTDLLPDAAVAGRVVATAPQPSEDDEIKLITDEWNTRRHWKSRVTEAVGYYGDWPEAIDAICAKETDKVAKLIREELAKGA